MLEALSYLRQFNVWTVLLRLVIAMAFGGMIGLNRSMKRRAAGFRTYMFVCTGAALAMLLNQYEYFMLTTRWGAESAALGVSTDVSRIGAQVINGIGFLAAGTILVTGRQEVKGLTTASGLWASACMGLAVGAGFYECVLVAFLLIFLSIRILPTVEMAIVSRARNINIYVEFTTLEAVGKMIGCIKDQSAHIYDVDITHGKEKYARNPSAVFAVRLEKPQRHDELLAALSDIDEVVAIDEV